MSTTSTVTEGNKHPNNAKAHKVDPKTVTKKYSKIPYADLAELLKNDEMAFLEHPYQKKIPRQTMHKACKKLEEMIGKPVMYTNSLLPINNHLTLEGYLLQLRPATSPQTHEEQQ